MNRELTDREKIILSWLNHGKLFKEIGNNGTIKNSLVKIRQKLDAVNVTHAVAIAMRKGLIS